MSKENNSNTFRLSEISEWRLGPDNPKKVKLPALQRGFVWKVSQIEELWDSILRGFPIGSFLLSKSTNEELLLLDGQQRATSITIGFYNPWDEKIDVFWKLKKIPILWIDLDPKEKTLTQKFVLRVITQSHPWGYQRVTNKKILIVSDREKAWDILRKIEGNQDKNYIDFDLSKTFPFDADLPVPLAFLIKAISENENDWKNILIKTCEKNLPIDGINKMHFRDDDKKYLDRLKETLDNPKCDIFKAIKNMEKLEIPKIIVENEILKEENEDANEDPTLFVRLNSSGTRIAGEELIYSIYKASFPETENLVEDIGATFIAPSLVISLVSRLALSEINGGNYPNPINVNEFIKKIKDEEFKSKLKELIEKSKEIFGASIGILRSENDISIPPALVKNIIKENPDLFLMLLQWVRRNNNKETEQAERKNILATITTLSWFGKDKKDNSKFVREVWENIPQANFWSKQFISNAFYQKNNFIIPVLILPSILRDHLLETVVGKKKLWGDLYPEEDSKINSSYNSLINKNLLGENPEDEIKSFGMAMWNSFIYRISWCKPLVLFAQRKYINEKFKDFNQMETLEDTNTPWDWDHIYPSSWVYNQRNVHPNTKHWTNSIGNLRALPLKENRSQNNNPSPKERLEEDSFINDNDWKFWSKIEKPIKEGDDEMIKNHLNAIILRLCNIYEEWHKTLNVDELFDSE